ncbi:MAG: multiheme c-type cytochrome [Planctomycetales bacterium]
MDTYCRECHEDAYSGWFNSAHHFSSFNNPAYLASVKETRESAFKRDGNVSASRWCAGCQVAGGHADRRRRGWLARSAGGQRHGAEFSVSQPARRPL